jgi:hypothetical protein
MATILDAAKALVATAGTEEDAAAAALELAAFCRKSHEVDEAAFWQAVAEALAWECNPQPLIAPDLGNEPHRPVRARPPASRRGLELPARRSTILRFQRDLRELWKRYRARKEAADGSKDEPGS